MSLLDSYLKAYASGNDASRNVRRMFEEGTASYEDFGNELDRASFIPEYENYLAQSDDHEYNERRADREFPVALANYQALRGGLMTDYLARLTPQNSSSSEPKDEIPVAGRFMGILPSFY